MWFATCVCWWMTVLDTHSASRSTIKYDDTFSQNPIERAQQDQLPFASCFNPLYIVLIIASLLNSDPFKHD